MTDSFFNNLSSCICMLLLRQANRPSVVSRYENNLLLCSLRNLKTQAVTAVTSCTNTGHDHLSVHFHSTCLHRGITAHHIGLQNNEEYAKAVFPWLYEHTWTDFPAPFTFLLGIGYKQSLWSKNISWCYTYCIVCRHISRQSSTVEQRKDRFQVNHWDWHCDCNETGISCSGTRSGAVVPGSVHL